MIFHEKEFQYNEDVSKPGFRLTKLLLKQFSGPYGELNQVDDTLFDFSRSIPIEDDQEDTETME